MKKTLSILTALMILLCSFVMTSCQHTVVADEDTWYKTSTSVSEVDIDVWFYYSTKPLKLKTYNGTKEVETTYEPGLTIVAIPDFPGMATYTVKHFNKSDVEEEVDEGGSDSVKIRANGTFMDALYIKFKSDFKASATINAPSQLSSKTYQSVENIAALGDVFAGKNWKSVLKDILNSVL